MNTTKLRRTTVNQTFDDPQIAGKGMPSKVPRTQRPRTLSSKTLKDEAVEATLELPHERDQTVDMTAAQSSAEVAQAKRDIDQGRKDTSKSVEMDSTYSKLKKS